MNLIEQLGGAKARFNSRSLVAGIGYNTLNISTKVNGKHTPEYVMWREMLRRCYSAEFQGRFQSYNGCTVSTEWHNFENFYNDLIEMHEYENIKLGRSYNLDKDLLVKGNNLYSKETCCILPQEVNKLITTRKSKRGHLPIGVHYSVSKRKFIAQVSLGAKRQLHVGQFDSAESAFNAYKIAKEAKIKEVADKYKDHISDDAYNALINYEVSIDD